VACPLGTSIQRAAELMAAADTGSVVVLGEDGQARGIITDSDLRGRVVAPGLRLETPVEAVMSSPVLTVPPETPFFEALGLMLERHIHHLVVADRASRVLGVVAESDLVAALGSGPLFLARRIARTASVEQLAEARAVFPEMARLLLQGGVRGYDLARITAETSDRLVRRALALAEAELGSPPLRYCWLGLGSEGRREQTLHTDQDHGLVYEDPTPEEAEPSAAYFLALGERVTGILEQCGIPRCKGGVMAANPAWNRPLATWQAYFSRWIAQPEPEALLNAAIFFDLRPVGGDAGLGEPLREQIARKAPHSRRFLVLLADQGERFRPPLGFFGRFVVERSGEHRGELDLKSGGLGPIVDLARAHALRHGVRATNTVERLRALGDGGHLPAQDARELEAAYEFLLILRLRTHLAQLAAGQPTSNYVSPPTLTRADRLLLKEYFALIARAQAALQAELATYLVG
jgi:CBS domain-containing protein